MKTVHYVATLSVKRVEVEDGTNTQGSYHNTHLVPGRKVGEVGTVTVRAKDMEILRQKVRDHLLVLDDDLNIPLDEVGKVTR